MVLHATIGILVLMGLERVKIHAGNGVTMNILNPLIGVKCRLTRQFWLGILKTNHGDTDTSLNMKITVYMRGVAELLHGVQKIITQAQLVGVVENWQRRVNKMTETQKKAVKLQKEIETSCVRYGLNLTIYDGKIGFVDQANRRIVMLWNADYRIKDK